MNEFFFSYFFLIFPRRKALIYPANCLHWSQFAWNVKTYFLEKNTKYISKIRLLIFMPKSMLVLKVCLHIPSIQMEPVHGINALTRWHVRQAKPQISPRHPSEYAKDTWIPTRCLESLLACRWWCAPAHVKKLDEQIYFVKGKCNPNIKYNSQQRA